MTFMNQLCVAKFRHFKAFEMPKFRHNLWKKNSGKNLSNAKENRMIKRVYYMLQL